MMQPNYYRVSVLVGVCLATGCTAFGVGNLSGTGLDKKEFASYVEKVFRFQNRMTSEVIMLTSAEDSGDFSELLQAEQRMRTVCAALNEYASRDIDGLSSSLTLQKKVVKSAVDCDHSAHAVEALLKK